MTNRREYILEEMINLGKRGIHCGDCVGHCCTFVGNSMMTTPLETFELLSYLKVNNMFTKELVEKIKECISWYRLDQEMPGNGKRSYSRRTYTCPFYMNNNLGCPIDPKYKPLGCLGFNPTEEGESEGISCRSDLELLQTQEDYNEKLENYDKAFITDHFTWPKKPMPVAILEVEEFCESHNINYSL